MKESFVVNAEVRNDQGKGASRRLRREGKVPAVLYGGHEGAQSLVVDHNELKNHLKTEAFYSHILTLDVGGKQQQVVLKDLQRHPLRHEDILHLDLYRILADKLLRRAVPLHFVGAEAAPGVKLGGGKLEHVHNEVEVECLPKDLPEYISVDVSKLELNQSIHLSELSLPEGVKLTSLLRGKDDSVCAVHAPKVVEEAAAAPAAADVPAANQKAPAAAAAPAKAAPKKK
ncbi:50S ribosomal protein L25/general stress protein Ctc [Stagnimonas aquatica]|uniref:Large ribosomal subunit protein bL25 n=1 Tax=Stagnimonas aquatica TaxID=2689987 RepID=A0A3N0VDX4_9GAMM|nr:50S ribosomal protein L25/general stress protein Ctc [Stagnimonas aquatica]ROH90916.1 50S ribosomal protein L25/general stress protein Ctc [Stagnimonas aquatica]